jgi:2-amino-4-hydroxy-6-hydroxymethyldihydropteridine diphosphokinase
VYRSPAYGMAGPDFLNLVVTFQVAVNADEVETVLSALEANSGRIPTPKIASRTLDLDLLIFGCGVNPAQRLPREDILRYPFVLAPLNDLSPELIHPVTGLSMQANWLRMAAAGHPLECVGTIGQL